MDETIMNVPFSALYDTSGGAVASDIVDVGNALVFSREQLEQTPSKKDGLGGGKEERIRLKSCEIVQGVLTLCGVDRAVICTAHIYLHRYYCQRSISEFHFKYVALGVIYLALKTEETNITEEELIPVFCRFLERAYLPESRQQEALDWVTLRSNEYELWWEWLVCLEMDILIAFGFNMHVPRPHKLMFTYIQKLELVDLMQEAWKVLNDSYLTTACVRYKSEVLACGSIFFVARKHKVALPEDGRYPWWALFGAEERELYEFAWMVQDLYNRPETDFDFTQDELVEYKNERPDGVKKPHPVLLNAPTDRPALPPETNATSALEEIPQHPGGEGHEEHREQQSPKRNERRAKRQRRDSRERRHRSSRHRGDRERHRSRRHRSRESTRRSRRH